MYRFTFWPIDFEAEHDSLNLELAVCFHHPPNGAKTFLHDGGMVYCAVLDAQIISLYYTIKCDIVVIFDESTMDPTTAPNAQREHKRR